MQKAIKRIFLPNRLVGFVLFNIGFLLLIYVFINHLEDTPIAYISYLLSSYALIIFCIWFYKVCRFSNDVFKKSKIYSLYIKHFDLITKASMYFSLIINFIYGIFKLVIGIFYASWWFITFAIYYLLLCFMKLTLVKNIHNSKKEYLKLKHIGMILLLLDIVLIGIIVLIIKHDQVIVYNGVLIYLIALYDFYSIISAIISVIKYRNKHNPIITASKCINLTVAMISILSLEVAMIYQFGNNDYDFKVLMTSLVGMGICLINSGMSIYMIYSSNKALNIKHK